MFYLLNSSTGLVEKSLPVHKHNKWVLNIKAAQLLPSELDGMATRAYFNNRLLKRTIHCTNLHKAILATSSPPHSTDSER